MQIQVLGSGCPTCRKLYEMTQKAVEELGIKTQAEYISGNQATQKIIELGLMASPVLLIDGQVVMVGASGDASKVKTVIAEKMGL